MLEDMFKTDNVSAFSNLLRKELDVEVRFRGRKIFVDYSMDPPTLFLPNMERAREEDFNIIKGFALHEAGHAVWTNFSDLESIKEYGVKWVHNAIEDERIERMLERSVDGARGMLEHSLYNGMKLIFEHQAVVIPPKKLSYLSAEGLEQVKAMMEEAKANIGVPFDTTDEFQVKAVSENLELVRVSGLWFIEKRGYNMPLHDWTGEQVQAKSDGAVLEIQGPNHPWYAIFHEETREPARSTKAALGQAMRIVERLGIDAAPLNKRAVSLDKKTAASFCDFARPCEEAKQALEDAEGKEREAANLRSAVEVKKAEREQEIKKLIEESDEFVNADEAKQELFDRKDDYKRTRERLAKVRAKFRKYRSEENKTKRGLSKYRKTVKKAERELAKLEKQIDRLQKKAEKAKTAYEKSSADNDRKAELLAAQIKAENEAKELKETLPEAKEAKDKAELDFKNKELAWEKKNAKREEQNSIVENYIKENAAAKDARDAAMTAYNKAVDEMEQENARITAKITEQWEAAIAPMEKEASNAEDRAYRAVQKANEILAYIKTRDEEAEAHIAPGAVDYLVAGAFEGYKGRDFSDEAKLASGAEDCNATLEDLIQAADPDMPIRTYNPYTREYDSVSKVLETPDGQAAYDEAVKEMETIIEQTEERLSRLWAPSKTDVVANRRRGQLDSRKAYKIAMAGKGFKTDLRRIWRDIKQEKTPKVAISLLLDCSRSMNAVNGVNPRAALTDMGEWAVPIHEKDPEGSYTMQELQAGLYIVQTGEQTFVVKTTDQIDGFEFEGSGRSPMAALKEFQKDVVENGYTRWKLTQKTAVALAEVCRRLNIPYEVLGHTTKSDLVPMLGIEEDISDLQYFSRFAPFHGLVFKPWDENGTNPPASIYSQIDMQDNLDGEGVLWQASRIQQRPERTKIMIVLSDGFPAAKYSHEGELQRHLYLVCKHVEAFEKDGMFLWGIGCKSDRVKAFFKNSSVLQDVNDLPGAALDAIEEILVGIVGSMG